MSFCALPFRAIRCIWFLSILLLAQACQEEEKEEELLNIQDIQLEGAPLSESFSLDLTDYYADVPFDVTSVRLSVLTKKQAFQQPMIFFNGEEQENDILWLDPGENKIEILAFSFFPTNKRIYTITVTRARSAYLTNISVVSDNFTFGEIDPEGFNKYNQLVSFDLVREISEISLQLDKEDTLATTIITYKGKILENNKIPLSIGENKCVIEVISADERSKKMYEVILVRVPKKDASIHQLSFSSGQLIPAFSSDIHSYELFVDSPTSGLTFETIIDEYGSQMYFYDNLSLSHQVVATSSLPKNLKINVLADDSITTDTYSVKIYHQSWEFIGRGAFDPRDGAGVVNFKNKLWLLGGWEGGPTVSEVWSSSNAKDWEFIAEAPWGGRHCAGFVVFKDRMWVISGDGFLDVWSSPDGITWTKELDNAPWGRRYAPYVVAFNNKLWLMGGANFYPADEFNLPAGPLNDVWNSDDGVNWNKVGAAPWEPRGLIHGHVVFNDKLWLVGGGSKDNAIGWGYNDVWNTSDGITWNLVTDDAPWAGRYHFSVATFDDKIWLSDGSIGPQNNLSNEVWFSSDGKKWEQIKNTPWAPTHASCLIGFEGSLYLISGYIRNDIWKFNLTK